MSSAFAPTDFGSSLASKLLDLGPELRYVAVAEDAGLSSRERGELVGASSSESDFYEELLVNPAILTLVSRRGALDCGGLRHVVVGYGRFNQLVIPTTFGHVSIAIEIGADIERVAQRVHESLAE